MNSHDNQTSISNDDYDRINELPDDLLQHILSFLGTREAVQTSLVSKRWMRLWTSLPCLNFDLKEFGFLGDEHKYEPREKTQMDIKFIKFVNAVLNCRQTSYLHTFLIKYPTMMRDDWCSDLVSTWIEHAMKYKPRVFSMEALIPTADPFARIFTCQSIQEMYLAVSFRLGAGSYSEIIPEVVNLPRVRRLQIKESEKRTQLDDTTVRRLLSGCPVLDEFYLENCDGMYSSIFNQKLRCLTLHHCRMKLPHGRRVFWKFFSAAIKSNLSERVVESKVIVDSFFLCRSPLLIKFAAPDNVSFSIQDFIYRLDLGTRHDFLWSLSGVTVLELSSNYMKNVLENVLPELSEFENLKDLSLRGWCMACNFNPVAMFIQKSPNLEKLTLYNCRRYCRMRHNHRPMLHITCYNSVWAELSRCKQLKQVEIKFSKELLEAHRLEEAWLLNKTKAENIQVVISEYDRP